MGPMSRDEKLMMGVMLAAIVMWVLGDQLAITPVTAAMLGLSALLLTGVLQWKECLQYTQVRAGVGKSFEGSNGWHEGHMCVLCDGWEECAAQAT